MFVSTAHTPRQIASTIATCRTALEEALRPA